MDQINYIEIGENFVQFPLRVAGREIMFRTHVHPHADEDASAVLIQMFGTEEWLAEHAPEGVVDVGHRFGKLDEHPDAKNGKDRDEEDCAATLVAKSLRVFNEPHINKILQYVFTADKHAVDVRNGLASAINMFRRVFPSSQIKNINWGMTVFSALFASPRDVYDFSVKGVTPIVQRHFRTMRSDIPAKWTDHFVEAIDVQKKAFEDACQEIEDKGCLESINGPHGRKLNLLVIESDLTEIAKAGRWGKGANADIILQKHSNGQVMIFTKTQANLKLYSLIRILNLEEQVIRGTSPLVTKDLTKEGNGADVGWYFQSSGKGGHFILNGSLSKPDVDPTQIPLETIVEYLKISLDTNCFPEDRRFGCVDKKECSSTPNNKCPWYFWFLPRCNEIRG